jgi:hypothetical protein
LESVTLENERTKIPSKQGKLINQWQTCHNPEHQNHQNDCAGLRTEMHYHIHRNLLLVTVMSQMNPPNLSTINLPHTSPLHPDLWSICSPQLSIHPSICMSPPNPPHSHPTNHHNTTVQ